MRSYPLNSPQAAARLVALAVLADGHLRTTELGLLERMNAATRLGLNRGQFTEVVRHLSEDLMTASYAVWGSACQIDMHALRSVAAEVTDPVLQRTTLELCVAVVRADFHHAEVEEHLVDALAEHWRLDKPGLHFN
ncbi:MULTISPECIES: TerB family tellurite resistance protein [Hydrogenophaga]|jgi:uncharacterized tellurite resistance protein B-like protein|uniref:Tellurite resistance protein B-like protein n=1 Tax=Hydrogenophaga laconesensis TaxID=1805971 RepID=A0ABU1VJX1_9BURK|nr:TerB family tellurite resistance protein [Hydrogenophaga laconesensis]MDR7097483.1 putative tellurite resistance protein B-like protein [Hydrogenophaga laconesensis]